MSKVLQAINEVMKKVHYVHKGGENTFHNYKYTTEADLIAALRPAMIEAGLVMLPSLDGEPHMDEHGNTHIVMAYTLAHTSGEVWPEKVRIAGSGNDRAKNGSVGDKGVFKSLTGCSKYALLKLFQIETGDDPEIPSAFDQMAVTPPVENGNGNAPRILPPAPQVPPTSGFYVPTQHDLTWSSLDEEFQKVIGEINQIGDLKTLGKYWSELTQFRETMQGADADLVSDMKAAFATRNNQIVGGQLK